MPKIDKKVLIASAIREIYEETINLKDILKYVKSVSNNLKLHGYSYETVNEQDVINFLRYHILFSKFDSSTGNININNLEFIVSKFDRFFLNDVDPKVKRLLISEKTFLLPVVNDNNLVIYTFTSNLFSRDEAQSIFYDDRENRQFLVDISKTESINFFLNSSVVLNKYSIEIDKLDKYLINLSYLTTGENTNIINNFNLKGLEKTIFNLYERIMLYYNLAKKNEKYLQDNSNIYDNKILKK